MQKNVITTKQAIYILILFIMGSSLVIGGNTDAKQDSWIAILIAVFLFAPMLMVYARLLSLYRGHNLYEIILDLFGKIVGKVLVFLYAVYSIYLGALVMRNFSEFLQVVALPETPQLITLLFMFVFCVWMAKSGIEILGRWSKFVFPISAAAILLILLLSFKFMTFSNLKPIMGTDFGTLMSSSFSLFSFPFAETILFANLFGSIEEKSENAPYKIYVIGVIVSVLLFVIVTMRDILVLGATAITMFYFPSYEAVSILSIGDFFTRFEVLIGTVFMFSGFVKISVCLFSGSIGVAKLINASNYKNLTVPVGLLMLTLASIVYTNTIEMFDWLNVYRFFALPFQVIIPLILLVSAEIKTRIKRLVPNN